MALCQSSLNSALRAKQIEAAAELAAKEAEYAVMIEEGEQMKRIQLLEEKQELKAEKSELETLQAVREVKAARARLEVYDREETIHSGYQNSELQQHVNITEPLCATSAKPILNEKGFSPPTNTDVSYLAQAVQDSMMLNRLPMPEPTIFSGDPIHFVEWKTSFQSLIDKRHISPADKLYYLKRYVTGPARKTLEGIF